MLTSPYPQPALLGTRQKRGQVSALVVSGVCAVIAVLSATGVLGAFSTIAYVMLGVFASASVIAGIFRFHPRRSWPWVAIATALLLFIVSLGLRVSYQTLGDLTPNRSLAPDYLALPGYLLLGLGLSGLVWARCGKSEGFTDTMLDAIIAGLAAMTLAWAFLIGPALANTHVSPLVKLTLSVYPPMSVMLLTLSVQLAFSGDGRTSRPAFLGAISAMGFMLVGDIIYNLADLRIATAPDWAIGLPYGMAFASIVYLAWHPTFREFSEPAAAADTQVGRFRLAIVGVALAVPAVVVSFETTVSVNDRVILGVIIVTLSCVAIARILRVIRRQADMQRLLLDQVSHDQLTGLPNRSLVMNQLARRIDRLERERGTIGLLFFDLDRFKLVNDAYGHGYGDDLLRAVADRLAGADLGADVVARIGGDEFVVLVGENATLAAVADTAERVRALMLQPIPVRELELGVSVSIGVAFVDQDGVDVTPESMLRDADTAMYRAKDAGRDSVVIFDSSMRERVARRLELETALRVALPNNELIVYYQPIVALPSGRIRGFEALLRWRHPVMGMVSPAEFIPIAEETGGIVEIGAFVLESALAYFGQLIRDLDAPGLTMSVNLSGRQLFTPGLGRRTAAPQPDPDRRPAPRGDRVGPVGRPRWCRRGAHSAPWPRGRALVRRLRYRLFLPRLPEAVPVRRGEDRPGVRRRAGPDGELPEVPDPGHRRHGRRAGARHRGRRRRDTVGGGRPRAARVQVGPGVPLRTCRPAPGGARGHSPPRARRQGSDGAGSDHVELMWSSGRDSNS